MSSAIFEKIRYLENKVKELEEENRRIKEKLGNLGSNDILKLLGKICSLLESNNSIVSNIKNVSISTCESFKNSNNIENKGVEKKEKQFIPTIDVNNMVLNRNENEKSKKTVVESNMKDILECIDKTEIN